MRPTCRRTEPYLQYASWPGKPVGPCTPVALEEVKDKPGEPPVYYRDFTVAELPAFLSSRHRWVDLGSSGEGELLFVDNDSESC